MKQLAKDQRGFMERRMGKSFEQSKKKSINFAYGQKFSWGELGVGLVSGAHDEDGDFKNDQMDYWLNWRGDLGFWLFDESKASLIGLVSYRLIRGLPFARLSLSMREVDDTSRSEPLGPIDIIIEFSAT
jgi:hypothetical protein